MRTSVAHPQHKRATFHSLLAAARRHSVLDCGFLPNTSLIQALKKSPQMSTIMPPVAISLNHHFPRSPSFVATLRHHSPESPSFAPLCLRGVLLCGSQPHNSTIFYLSVSRNSASQLPLIRNANAGQHSVCMKWAAAWTEDRGVQSFYVFKFKVLLAIATCASSNIVW